MSLTAEEFAEQLLDLPDAGRWTELIAGEVVQLTPPDTMHGTTVLNLSKRLAEHRQQAPEASGAACFDLGLITNRRPDTVLVPAVSVIPDVGPFELADAILTERVPSLVVEIPSTHDRQHAVEWKIETYLEFGIESVWVVEHGGERVRVISQNAEAKLLFSSEQLQHEQLLPGFQMPVRELFQEPEWWTGNRRN
jgi:Uma2 family endonuclease